MYRATSLELVSKYFSEWSPASIRSLLAAPHLDLPLEVYNSIPELIASNQGDSQDPYVAPRTRDIKVSPGRAANDGDPFVYLKGVDTTLKDLEEIGSRADGASALAGAMATKALEDFKKLRAQAKIAKQMLAEDPDAVLHEPFEWEYRTFRPSHPMAAALMDAKRAQGVVQVLQGGKYRTGRRRRSNTEAQMIQDDKSTSLWTQVSRRAWIRAGRPMRGTGGEDLDGEPDFDGQDSEEEAMLELEDAVEEAVADGSGEERDSSG